MRVHILGFPMRSQIGLASRVLLLLAVATPSHAQFPPGYFLADSPALPDSLYEEYQEGLFTISVIRESGDSLQSALIRTAERVYPERETIEAAARTFLDEKRIKGRWPENMREAAEADGTRWWWHRWDPVWVLFALTGAAVDHYVTTIRELAAEPRVESDISREGSFEYRATVEEYQGSRIVHLVARWSYYCGPLCGIWFTEERRVHFDSDGAVTLVEGDGRPSFMVS